MGRPAQENHSEYKKATVKGVKANGSSIKVEKKTKPRRVVDGVSRGQSQSCHQCRQSIHSSKGVSEVKQGKARLKCSTCTRFW